MEVIGRSNGRRMPSMFFKRGRSIEYVRRGASFRCVRRNGETETAVISAVHADAHGIPHVCFDIVLEKPSCAPVKDGPRSLSAKEFFRQFTERVSHEGDAPAKPAAASAAGGVADAPLRLPLTGERNGLRPTV